MDGATVGECWVYGGSAAYLDQAGVIDRVGSAAHQVCPLVLRGGLGEGGREEGQHSRDEGEEGKERGGTHDEWISGDEWTDERCVCARGRPVERKKPAHSVVVCTGWVL